MNKSVLITGVAGLLGSRLADWILENEPEYEVVGIDNLFGGYMDNVDERVVFYKHELSTDSLGYIFEKHQFEYVFHFAAYAAEGLSPFMRRFNDMNNMASTDNIINECVNHNVKRLVYTSSMSVYGSGIYDGRLFNETDRPMPEDPYAVSKYACEMNIQNAGKIHGLDWCIIRPHNVYGIKQNIWDKYRNVIGIWMNQALNEQPMLIYGDGLQTRSFSYIDDILEPLWNSAVYNSASNQIINLGGIYEDHIYHVCDIVKKVTGWDKVEHREPRYEVRHAYPDYKKSMDVLNFRQKTSLEDGIKKMWEWAQKQPKREQYKWDKYEIEKGIYSYWK